LSALIRRVVASRLADSDAVDDIVQKTLVRLLAARGRLDEHALTPYAIVTARNPMASFWQRNDTRRRLEHGPTGPPVTDLAG
jgi:serine/threonine-protein kinase RsbT